MASVNQTRPHCVNQMGKTHSKPGMVGEWHGRGIGTACCVYRPLRCHSVTSQTSLAYCDSITVQQNDKWESYTVDKVLS